MKVGHLRSFFMLICLESIRILRVKLSWTMQKPYKKVFLSNCGLSVMVNYGLSSLQIWRLSFMFDICVINRWILLEYMFANSFFCNMQICSWEFCARRHEELIPRRLLIPQVLIIIFFGKKMQETTMNSTTDLLL